MYHIYRARERLRAAFADGCAAVCKLYKLQTAAQPIYIINYALCIVHCMYCILYIMYHVPNDYN